MHYAEVNRWLVEKSLFIFLNMFMIKDRQLKML